MNAAEIARALGGRKVGAGWMAPPLPPIQTTEVHNDR